MTGVQTCALPICNYEDEEKGLSWMWGPGFPCVQMPLGGADTGQPPKEEPLGSEVVAGHPTKKFKVTTTYKDGKQTVTDVRYVWRATDLGDLAIRSRSGDGTMERNMLYIGFGDSPAILINYRPAGKGGPADRAEWQHFLDSLQPAK